MLVLFVLATRLPFIFEGYGIDGDSWSVAITARHLHDTGEYTASRLPGYPVHEVLSSFFIDMGPAGLNLLSAIVASIKSLEDEEAQFDMQAKNLTGEEAPVTVDMLTQLKTHLGNH